MLEMLLFYLCIYSPERLNRTQSPNTGMNLRTEGGGADMASVSTGVMLGTDSGAPVSVLVKA